MSENSPLPILYSFRRCPYAMRARLAIAYSGIAVELREVVLRDKPREMLRLSPKGTVPVLALPNGEVLDESYDIMKWALSQKDADNWRLDGNTESQQAIEALVAENDGEFKHWLDRYKYADRYPEHPMEYYRTQCEKTFRTLNTRLQVSNGYLMGKSMTLADAAIRPFIRQCAHVDRDWFYATEYVVLQQWLDRFLESELFRSIMHKYPQWKAGRFGVNFGDWESVGLNGDESRNTAMRTEGS